MMMRRASIRPAFEQADFLTPKQVAERFGVHINTVDSWLKAGKLVAEQPYGPRGRRFIRKDLLRGFRPVDPGS